MLKARTQSLLHVLHDALKLEQDGAEFFRDALQRVENRDAAKAIIRLIDEEEKHIRLISRSIEGLKEGSRNDPAILIDTSPVNVRYFDVQAQKEFLRHVRENPTTPDLTVFKSAWRMEKEIRTFYEREAERIDGPVQKLLRVLCDFEKHHEAFFRTYHDERSSLYDRVYRERPWA